jgi:hypothetical protein
MIQKSKQVTRYDNVDRMDAERVVALIGGEGGHWIEGAEVLEDAVST